MLYFTPAVTKKRGQRIRLSDRIRRLKKRLLKDPEPIVHINQNWIAIYPTGYQGKKF